ncbi:hypothetical protein OSTOST_09047 [Ostertagia ostertagi]
MIANLRASHVRQAERCHCGGYSNTSGLRYADLQVVSETTLWRLMKGLGGQRFIFERADLSLKRSSYLSKVKEARERGDCVVYMDETWVFEGMVKRKGWVDTTMPRFPSAEMMRNYSFGKNAGKTKGKRGILMTALSEDGIVPGLHPPSSGQGDNVSLSAVRYHTCAISTERAKLNYFVESRGGLASLRCYAAEKICSDLGVTLIRLPPFHCFFNPVESCWSYLKHRLNKIGRPTDKLETVILRKNYYFEGG